MLENFLNRILNSNLNESLPVIIAIVLNILTVAGGVVLYFQDIRKKIEQINAKLDKIIPQQQTELKEIGKEQSRIQIDYNKKVLDSVEQIKQGQEGVLNKSQAVHLAKLYLDSVKIHLEHELDRLAGSIRPEHFCIGQERKIMNELHESYRNTVHQSLRPLVSPFKLRGGPTFERLVEQVNTKPIMLAFEEIEKILDTALRERQEIGIFISDVQTLLQEVGAVGKEQIIGEIELLYSAYGLESSQSPVPIQRIEASKKGWLFRRTRQSRSR